MRIRGIPSPEPFRSRLRSGDRTSRLERRVPPPNHFRQAAGLLLDYLVRRSGREVAVIVRHRSLASSHQVANVALAVLLLRFGIAIGCLCHTLSLPIEHRAEAAVEALTA